MKLISKYISVLIVTILLFSFNAVSVYAGTREENVVVYYENIKIFLNGKQIVPKDAKRRIVEPFIIDGTTYLPVRAIGNALSYNVDWEPETNTVVLEKNKAEASSTNEVEENIGSVRNENVNRVFNEIKIKINNVIITPQDVNGNIVEPFIIDGTTYLPLRAICNSLNIDVNWDDNDKTISLTSANIKTRSEFTYTKTSKTKTHNSIEEDSIDLELVERTKTKMKNSLQDSVVKVTSKNASKQLQGTGFFFDNNNLVLTNYHVVDACNHFEIEYKNSEVYEAFLVKYNKNIDLAVLYVPDIEDYDYLSFEYDDPEVDEVVYAVGYPAGTFDVTDGVISSLNYYVGGKYYIVSSAFLTHGNSGGPLLNQSGKVIGVNVAKVLETNYMTIPNFEAIELIDSIDTTNLDLFIK